MKWGRQGKKVVWELLTNCQGEEGGGEARQSPHESITVGLMIGGADDTARHQPIAREKKEEVECVNRHTEVLQWDWWLGEQTTLPASIKWDDWMEQYWKTGSSGADQSKRKGREKTIREDGDQRRYWREKVMMRGRWMTSKLQWRWRMVIIKTVNANWESKQWQSWLW